MKRVLSLSSEKALLRSTVHAKGSVRSARTGTPQRSVPTHPIFSDRCLAFGRYTDNKTS